MRCFRVLATCAVLGGVSLATGALAQGTESPPVAATRHGPVRGSQDSGIRVFKGIPYGAPTGGQNRFRAPQLPPSWTQPRDATHYRPRCPQLPDPPHVDADEHSQADVSPMSEDCLTLSVWTPGLRDGRKRPVMVWLHGGGYSVGSGNSPVNDGVRLARRGDVVVVSVNHRLNVFGYLYLADIGGADFADSGNAGQLDIIAALKWVRDNITEFGGDPQRVLVFGESGGGGKVGTLLAMPAAQGLFQRAAMQSGFAVTVNTRERSNAFAKDLMNALGLGPTQASQLRRLDVQQILDAFNKVTGGSPILINPVVDGRNLPRHPFTPGAPVISANVPLIVGYNATETTVLFPPPGVFDLDWPGLERQLKSELPDADVGKLISEMRQLRPKATASDLYFFITTERGMGANAGIVATRKTALGGAPVFMYRLVWPTPVLGGKMRTPHGLDVPLVFDNVAAAKSQVGSDTFGPQKVAEAMSSAWIAFARTGSPNGPGLANWPVFSPTVRPVMTFDTTSRAIEDPLRREHQVLAPYLPAPSP
ncbi:MAG: carboxylesterase family protein [Pseudomonadota bacterium]